MTTSQRTYARHALGLPNKKLASNRNYFRIGAGGNGYDEWEQMVAQGDAIKRAGAPWAAWGSDDTFFLTLQGALAALDPKEHIGQWEVP